MNYPGYTDSVLKLADGESYSFFIHNHIQLTDNEFYFVLIDINGLKHFLLSEPYKSYGLSIGQNIDCKIDKINCTGRIYLEPEHPYYKLGHNYNFIVNNCKENSTNQLLTVFDIYNNSIDIEIEKDEKIEMSANKIIHCKVNRIKKGIPILVLIK